MLHPLTLIRSFFVMVAVLFLFSSCRENTEKHNDEPMSLEELLNAPSYADSIVAGTPVPLKENFVEAPWILPVPMAQLSIPVKQMNRTAVMDTMIRNSSGIDTLYNVKPQVVSAQPAISYVVHPVPVKAGGMRTTGLANQNIQYLDGDQGLISSTIADIYEDSRGFLWIGHSNGLTMYDGNYFYDYSAANGLVGGPVSKILPAGDGSLWLATNGGLVHYDGRKFETYTMANGLLENGITDILFDDNGDLWLSTVNRGFSKFVDGKFYHYTTEGGAAYDRVISLGLDSLGRIFIGYYGSNPGVLDGDKIYMFRDQKYLQSSIIPSCFRDSHKQLWTCAYAGDYGVSRFSPGRASHTYKLNTGFSFAMTSAIYEDSNGNMWFGTNSGGLVNMRDGFLESYTINEGLSTNKITCIAEDRNGNIWVGTNGGGINRITPKSFRNIAAKEGFSDKNVASIYENSKHEILFGTWADGLWIYNGESFRRPWKDDAITPRIILAMSEDSADNLIVSTHGFGVYCLQPGRDTLAYATHSVFDAPGYNPAYAYSQQKDSKGRLWMSCQEKGLLMREGNRMYRYGTDEGLPTNTVMSMSIDRDDDIWLANFACGISKVDPQNKTVTNYTRREGLLSNYVNVVHAVSNGTVFITSEEGLSIFDGTAFSSITQKDGLSCNNITSIAEDREHRVWVGTTMGLNLLTPDTSGKSGYRITTFYSQDGLKSLTFNLGAVLLDSRNTMWWGTSRGVISLNLDEFDQQHSKSDVYFTGIDLMGVQPDFVAMIDSAARGLAYTVNDGRIDFSNVAADSVVRFANCPAHLSLPYDVNSISFHYAAFGGVLPHKIQYRYMLEGDGNQWSQPTAEPVVTFSNLSSGTYTLHVVARSEGKEWSKEVSYSFAVNPPFWERWWFRLLEVIVAVAVLVSIFRLRTRQLRHRQKVLETTVEERTQEIKQQKHIVEEKQKEIIDSITYAKRLQEAILATPEEIRKGLPDNFLFYRPKDIVAGDFYFFETTDTHIFYAACDCTGHGVPGAMVSVVCSNALTRCVREFKLTDPGTILGKTRELVLETFRKSGSDVKDGMDISFLVINRQTKEIKWAGANNPLWYLVSGEMTELKADKQPIGAVDNPEPFTSHTLPVASGMIVYLLTDGYPDQFGGPKGKKFKYNNLKNLLIEIAASPMPEQKEALERAFESWKGELEQVDDVCVIGVRI